MPTFSVEVGATHIPKIAVTARDQLVSHFTFTEEEVAGMTDYQCAQAWTKRVWQHEIALHEGRVAGGDATDAAKDEMEPVPEP